jgi:deoxyribonuclease V
VKINQLHNWQVNIQQAKQIQRDLASQLSRKNETTNHRFIAGADISAPASSNIARAAVVLLEYPSLEVIEVQTSENTLFFPYVPGFLSFRESPLLIAAFEKLSTNPDILLVDGQGIAHPRRLGIASHLGLILDIPSIGCAKSRLCGKHKSLITGAAGSYTELIDNNEIIGAAVITKNNTKPVYVSIGHKVDLPTAIHWVMECCTNYRLPEPCRLAHIAASGKQIFSKTPIESLNQIYLM